MKRKHTPLLIQRTDGFAREPEREVITGVPPSSWRKMQDEGRAPRPFRLSSRSVAWWRSDLFAWCEQRLQERKATWSAPASIEATASASVEALTEPITKADTS
jgi:predicted DNA-binding transcriptional regulator AlpA